MLDNELNQRQHLNDSPLWQHFPPAVQQILLDYLDLYINFLRKKCGIEEPVNERPKLSNPEKNSPDLKQEWTFENTFRYWYIQSIDFEGLRNFLAELRNEVSDPEWARFALTLYNCKEIICCKRTGFTKWLPRFCALFGREVAYREPKDISRTQCKHNITCYLPKKNK